MSKVVAIRGGEIDEGSGAVKDVVEFLRERLAAAERGEIVSLAMVTIDPADKICTKSSGGNRHLLIAGTVYLQLDMTKD